jgi:alginate O-acetyltransferase complex protein AlgI
MSFTSLEFPLFLGLCMIVLHGSGKLTARTAVLTVFSYIVCLSFGWDTVAAITALALADCFLGLKIGAQEDDGPRKRWLWLGLSANLLPLALFKYSGFAMESVGTLLRPLGVHVPAASGPAAGIVGLSYFTFCGISYLLDVYYGKMEPSRSLSEYVCFLVCFPKLIAGPIVRAVDFLPQLRRGLTVSAQDIEIGAAYLLSGAVKKLVIADRLAGHVGMIMGSPQNYDAVTLLQGLVGYTVQIYADFSGYSDMAIGCARLMGIRFPQNFLMPYSSVNIAEFWRRWHVTMSNWFRDYVFLPLEVGSRGMRSATVRASRNVVITMLLCGLWHGANWNFVVWGGIHGAALAIYQVFGSLRGPQSRRAARAAFHPYVLASRVLTLSVVMLAYVVFGTPTLAAAAAYLHRMLTWTKHGVALNSPYMLPAALLVFVTHLLIHKDRNLVEEMVSYPVPARAFTYASLLLLLTTLVASEAVPFVYVRF